MKKIVSTVAGAVTIALFFGTSAFAASISNTGVGSNNSIHISSSQNCTIRNNTNVNISNSNSQSSSSGNASVSGNNSGGNATSGSTSNSSSTNFNLSVNNGNLLCSPQTVTPPPSNGGGGSTQPPSSNGQVSGVSTQSQVQAPVGGVGAGAGGLTNVILSASLLSGALGLYRLRKHLNHEAA